MITMEQDPWKTRVEKLKYQTLKQYNQEANTETTIKN